MLVEGCGAFVDLAPPVDIGDADLDGGEAAADTAEDTTTASDASANPAPEAGLWPLQAGTSVTGLAIGSKSLGVVLTDGTHGRSTSLYWVSLLEYPQVQPLVDLGFSTDVRTLTSTDNFLVTAYQGSPGEYPFVQIYDSRDVWGVNPLFNSSAGVSDLASDTVSVFWTEQQPSAHLRKDLADVLLTATAGDAFGAVAVDDANVYTVGQAGGAIYAVPKNGTDGGGVRTLATGAPFTGPIVAHHGQVLFAPRLTAGPVRLVQVTTDGDAAVTPTPYTVGPFTVDDCGIFFGMGPSVYLGSEGPIWGGSPTLLDTLDSDIVAVAVGNGFLAYASNTTLKLVPEPTPCPGPGDGGSSDALIPDAPTEAE
jgi:hypothetical protein